MKDIYILSNYIDNTHEINLPLKHTQRVKYTCFNASKNYLIFGASSGSLYIFQRKPCKFLQLIPTKYRSITNISISPNERFVAFTTQKGIICVLIINISSNSIPQLITTNIDGINGVSDRGGGGGGGILNSRIDDSELSTINCIHWSSDEKQFYYGNNKGDVYLITLTFFVGKTLIDITVHPILFLDSSIVQICEFESLLLVSNLMKCILCNMDYEEYKQIGNQPRDGLYGACFSIIENNDYISSRIFCSRPGYRIWEINLEGNVIKTHEFKTALLCKPTKIIDEILYDQNMDEDDDENDDDDNNDENIIDDNYDNNTINNEHQYTNDNRIMYSTTTTKTKLTQQNLQFTKLQTINNSNFILTFNEYALYILDPREPCVILWSNKFNGIIDCIVIDNEIIIFTKLGHIYTIYLQTLQSYVIDLIQQQKMNYCIKLLRKNLKYFAEKAKENYELLILDEIKTYLIQNNQYDILNDLSVVFDCLTLRKDNINHPSNLLRQQYHIHNNYQHQHQHQQHQQQQNININYQKRTNNGSGVYVLENSFCDNLKNKTTSDKLIKDMLLTVTGKFGKNIIKYKLNIFNDEQKSLVEDLIPPIEKNIPFQEIYEQCDNENDDIICNHVIVKNPSFKEQTISEEEKTVYDLYLIWKSSKISNTCFLERYRTVFDKYTSEEIIKLLSKLEKIMIENGDTYIDAKINCYEMYFNYLKPELLWEINDDTRNYIKDGFILLNTKNNNIINCDKCKFPIRFSINCYYRNIGEILFKFYQSRNEQKLCIDLIKNVPSLIDIFCKYLIQEEHKNLSQILIMVLNYGDNILFNDISRYYDYNLWNYCFELFSNIKNGKYLCSQCNEWIYINEIINDKNSFYTWNCFLNIALNYLNGEEILSFILKYSNLMPNNCIERETFIRCLLK